MYRFEGYDYTELGHAFRITMPEEDKERAKRIQKFLTESLHTRREKYVARTIRRYIEAMLRYRKIDYLATVYDGMLKIPSDKGGDEILIKTTIRLLTMMWT